MIAPTYSIRQGIRELLALLASEEEQLAYERDVPIANVPAELVCMWFDDTYHPDAAWFRPFTTEELLALAEFHAAYAGVVQRLPPSQGSVGTWHACPVWKAIMTAAARALASVPVEPIDGPESQRRAPRNSGNRP